MRTLKFKIKDQRLSKDGDFSLIVKGTKNYLRCLFTFDDPNWNGLRKIAVFENRKNGESAVFLERDNSCNVPNEVTDENYFKVKVVGANGSTQQIITNKILISQK